MIDKTFLTVLKEYGNHFKTGDMHSGQLYNTLLDALHEWQRKVNRQVIVIDKIEDAILNSNATGEEMIEDIQKVIDAEDCGKVAVLRQTDVSGSLPVADAIKVIQELIERWYFARDNDDETLQGIYDALVKIGLLGRFNRK